MLIKGTKEILIYVFCFALGGIAWFATLWPFLSGHVIFSHDSFRYYPIFSYFVECINSGFLPLWTPYIHCGEPFFLQTGMFMLIDPVTFLVIFFGNICKIQNLFLLYEISVFLRIFILAVGIVLLFNHILPPLKKYSYFLFFVVLLSSFAFNSYHQNGALYNLGYIPFILYFFFKFIKHNTWLNATLLAYFTGISCRSILFAYTATFMIIFFVLFCIFEFKSLLILFSSKVKIIYMVFIFMLLTAPVWILIYYSPDSFPYGRYIQSTIHDTHFFFQNYKSLLASGGAYGQITDILCMGLMPFVLIYPRLHSELMMFVGLIPCLIGIIGIIFCRHRLKIPFLILLILCACLFIGPVSYNFIYKIFFMIIPFLRLIHNYHEFSGFFLLVYFFFFALGILFVAKKTLTYKWIIPSLFIITLISLLYYNYYFIGSGTVIMSPLKVDKKLNALMQAHYDFKLRPRVKSVDLLNDNKYSYRSHTFEMVSLILKIPIAVDFPDKKYAIIKQLPPRALIYPKLYTDILMSKTSQKLKAILLGVNLPVFSLYNKYTYMPEVNILNPANNKTVINNLRNSIILSSMLKEKLQESKILPVYKTKLIYYDPNNVKLKAEVNQNGFLLFRDGYTPDWQVKVDGKREKLFRANYNEKAVYIKKGIHIVEFLYRPWKYLAALMLYCLATLWVIGFLIFFLIIRKGKSQNS